MTVHSERSRLRSEGTLICPLITPAGVSSIAVVPAVTSNSLAARQSSLTAPLLVTKPVAKFCSSVGS